MTIGKKQISSLEILLSFISILLSVISVIAYVTFTDFRQIKKDFVQTNKDNAIQHAEIEGKLDGIIQWQEATYNSDIKPTKDIAIDNEHRLTVMETKIGLY